MRIRDGSVACALVIVGLTACGGDHSGGQVHEIEIPVGHPRLWFSTPELLARAKDNFHAKYGDSGETYNPHDDVPAELAFGYLMTGNKDWAQKALAWAVSVTDPKDDSSDPNESVSDPFRFYGEDVALVYDWCHDAMSSDQQDTLISRWNTYVTNENGRSFGGVGYEANNYYWGRLRNSLEWGIATSNENPSAPGFVEAALDDRWTTSFLPYAKATGAGGVPEEGTEYGRYHVGYPVIPFATAGALGRDIYNETDFFLGSVLYIAYGSTPARTEMADGTDGGYQMFDFDDDQSWGYGNSALGYAAFLQTMAVRQPDKAIGRYARTLLEMQRPDFAEQRALDPWIEVLDVRKDGDAADLSALPLDYYAPGPGYLWTRDQWGPNATSIFVPLGQPYGVGHWHQDWGTFQIWRDGRWVARESAAYGDAVVGWNGDGSEDGDGTIAHNGMLFEGVGHNTLWSTSKDNYCDGPPVVQRLESRDAYTYAAVDLGKSYRAHGSDKVTDDGHLRDDNAHVKSYVREYVFVRGLAALVVLDRLESSAFDRQDLVAANGPITPRVDDPNAVRKTFLAHFETPVTVSGNVASAMYGSQKMVAITAWPTSGTTVKVVDETGTGGSAIGQYRLEVTESGAAQSYFVHVLGGVDAGADALTASATDDGSDLVVTIARGAQTSTVTFAKGMTSAGGSIDGAAFTDKVQQISVDRDGPHWH